MPRLDLTDITFVLDRSGSMQSIKAATIEAFNGFLNSQKTGVGAARMTLVQFDDQYELLYQGIRVADAPDLTEQSYVPRNSTALLDAIGRTIVATGERFRQLPERGRPGTVIFVTLTDGHENASQEYTLRKINGMVREQREKYAWQFLFLGANQDAIATAAEMGVGAGQSMTFTSSASGTLGCINALDRKLHRMRETRSRGVSGTMVEFDDADRNAARGKGE